MPTTTPAPTLNRFAPFSIFRMIWKGKLLILVVWVAVSAAAILWVSTLRPVYLAEATVVVNSQKIPERYVSATVNADLQDRLASISQQILSSTALQKIMDDFGLYREERKQFGPEDAVERMRKAITIVPDTKAFA